MMKMTNLITLTNELIRQKVLIQSHYS